MFALVLSIHAVSDQSNPEQGSAPLTLTRGIKPLPIAPVPSAQMTAVERFQFLTANGQRLIIKLAIADRAQIEATREALNISATLAFTSLHNTSPQYPPFARR